jgi:hypothetical protein
MEDLLASIRRAIHDDIGDVPSPNTGQPPDAVFKGAMRELRVKVGGDESAAAIEILDLREKINRTRASEIPRGEPRLRFLREAETVAPESGFWDDAPPGLAPRAEERYPPEPGMLSADAQMAAANAFNKLADTLLNRPPGHQPVEEMTRDLLRGMLKHWLDANLPGLVERLVREEIERVARRGR